MIPRRNTLFLCHLAILGTLRPDGGRQELFAPLLFDLLWEAARSSLRLSAWIRCASCLKSHSSSSRVRRVTREVASTSRARVLLYSDGSMALLFGGPAASSSCSSWKRPVALRPRLSTGLPLSQRFSQVSAPRMYLCGHGRSLIPACGDLWLDRRPIHPST
jgi:AhpD family alkylhydroperoxidase